MTEPVLSVRDLRKRIVLHVLGGKVVEPLRGVSFDLDEGEFLGVIGVSGAGKSSLIKCLNRTYVADGGEAWYRPAEGERVDLLHAPERDVVRLRQREVRYASQFLKAPPRVQALDVVAAGMVARGAERVGARDRAASMLERLGIAADLHSSYPALFSGGEQQRVNVACALVDPPRLLLLDEPTSALDAQNRERVLEALRGVREQGTATIAILHDLDILRRLADRVLVLEEGRAAQLGRLDEVELPAIDVAAVAAQQPV